MSDETIIRVTLYLGCVLAWAVMIAAILGAALAIFWFAYRLVRNAVGTPVLTEAIREYRRTHPERFKKFDATKIDGL